MIFTSCLFHQMLVDNTAPPKAHEDIPYLFNDSCIEPAMLLSQGSELSLPTTNERVERKLSDWKIERRQSDKKLHGLIMV